MANWIETDAHSLGMATVSAIVVFAAIIIYCRIAGLRSFSKMSAPDFAMTVAVGSLFGATISSPSPTLFLGLFSLAMLFALQWLVAFLRRHVAGISDLIDNQPLLLMRRDEVLQDNLDLANVTRADLMAKLREANVHHFSQVRAVVFEATGDVSILHADSEELPPITDEILAGVNGWEADAAEQS